MTRPQSNDCVAPADIANELDSMGTRGNGKRILVVEDDAEHRDALASLLREAGYAVTEAAGAEEALDRLDLEVHDLVVTDYRLGGAPGTWLARIAAGRGHLGTPQVLIITGFADLADAGDLQVIRKPIEAASFLAKIERALASPTKLSPREQIPFERIAFTLYSSGSLSSRRALRNLRAILGEYVDRQVALTIVDKELGTLAEEDRILVTPTLLKTFPAPRAWIVGDLEEREAVDRLLEHAGVERKQR